MKKDVLKEMFNFTSKKKETIKIGIILCLQLLLYTFSYPFIMQSVVDNAIPNENIELVIILSIVLIIIVVLRFFTNRYSEIKRKSCYYDNNAEIKKKVFESIQEAKVSELDKIQSGNLFAIVGPQAWDASQLFVWNLVGIISVRLSLTIAISLILFLLNAKIGIIIISIFIISYLLLVPFYVKTIKVYKKIQKIIIDLQGSMNEYIEAYSTTKTLKLEDVNLNDIENILDKCKAETLKSSKIIALHNGLFSLLSFGAVLAVLIVGGSELAMGIGLSSTIMLMVDYVDDINRHMKSLLDHVHGLNNKYSCFLNVLNVHKITKEVDEGNIKLSNIKKIEFKNVSLSYDGMNMILDKINFSIDKSMKVAIVGKSGAGKTSLVNLIPRLYEICEGSILINDLDYREYKLNSIRERVAYVFQEPVIFGKTIIENITFGCGKKINKKQVYDVCKKLEIDSKIRSLPSGYDTLIDAKTDLLSYGEKQLLSFARAILKDADLVILDEVTSNLDLEFESAVIKATKEIMKNKISFVIAHRLNTIKDADIIFFIEDKKIVEMGTHKELMMQKGKYYNLYASKEK